MNFIDIHTHSVDGAHAITSVNSLSLPLDKRIVHASIGIHPWFLTEENTESQLTLLAQACNDKRVVAIGEGGLDKLKGAPLSVQNDVFRKEIALSEAHGLPMVIHCVRAFNELIQLKKALNPHQPWIIHGFRSKASVAQDLLRQGCWISFGEKFQPDALRSVPLDRLFIETDESEESIASIYQRIAETKGISLLELTEAINKNVREVFFKR